MGQCQRVTVLQHRVGAWPPGGESRNPGNPGMWIFSGGGGRVFARMLLLQLCCLSLTLARQSRFSRLSRQGKNSRLLTWGIPEKGPAAPISLFGRFGERERSGGGRRRDRQHAAILRSIELTNKEEEARENDRLLERLGSGEERERSRRQEEEIERRAKKKKQQEQE